MIQKIRDWLTTEHDAVPGDVIEEKLGEFVYIPLPNPSTVAEAREMIDNERTIEHVHDFSRFLRKGPQYHVQWEPVEIVETGPHLQLKCKRRVELVE